VSACTGGSGQYVEHQMAVAEKVFSISVEVPNGIAEDGNSVEVIAQMLPDGNTRSASESNAVYVDGTPPVLTLGTPPTTPTTNPRPTWTWSGSDALSGLDYYIVTLDGELPFETTGTSFTPSSDLVHGTHVLKVKAVDKAGNVGMEQSFSAVTISTAPPAAPAIATLAAGYNTSPIEIDWNDVTDGSYAIAYVLQYADNAGFSGATSEDCPTSDYSFDAEAAGEGEYWFRVKTISTVNDTTDPKQTKESGWSAVVSTIYDATAPAAPTIALVTPSPTNEPLQEWSWTRTAVDIVRFQFGESADGTLEPTSYLLDGDVDNAVTNFTTDGAHHVMVRAIDAVGNVGAWSAAASVIVDLTPPGVPKNLGVQTPTRNNTPEWTWDAADNPDGDLTGYELLLDGAVVIDVGNVLSYTHSEMLGDGIHTMEARSYDRLGNSSAWTDPATSVLVDATPPEAPGMPRTQSPTANRRPTWTWNATSGAVTYRVFLDGVAQQPVDTESNPNGIPQPGTTFTPAADLADGRHDLQVTAIDALGNESAKSAAGSVLVDGTAPAVPDIAHLPTYTKATRVVFRWSSIGDVAGYDFSYSLGDSDTWTTLEGITKQSYVVNDPDDGVSVKGRVRAYDSLRNTSGWSDTVSTTVDLTGPVVSITSPAAAKNTNLSAFTWTWTGSDGERGSGVQGYWVKLNDEAWSWTTGTVFTSSRLQNGVNILRVRGVDSVGNEGAIVAAPAVTLVDAVIFDIHPEPGAHPINEVSTIAFSVAGLYDGRVEVLLGDKPIEDGWRLVTVVRTPELAKFYVLLDADIMQPGMLTVTIRVGNSMISCAYRVLSERTGFGFGRLRPW